MPEIDSQALVSGYLDIVNRALARHRARSPYAALFAMGRDLFGHERVGVALYERSPVVPSRWFNVAFDGARFHIVALGRHKPAEIWRLSAEHLHEVVADPAPYLEAPARLDLAWLHARVAAHGHEDAAAS